MSRSHEELSNPGHKPRALPAWSAPRRSAIRPDVIIGCSPATSSKEPRAKLAAVGIDPTARGWRLRLGSRDTRELPRSQSGVHASRGQHVVGEDIVIIGDTPSDVQCGQSLGVRAIGVATGHYSAKELMEWRRLRGIRRPNRTPTRSCRRSSRPGGVVIELELKAVVADPGAAGAACAAGAGEVFVRPHARPASRLSRRIPDESRRSRARPHLLGFRWWNEGIPRLEGTGKHRGRL